MSRTKPDSERAEPGRVSPTAPESKSMSSAVWSYLESQPGFNEALDDGKAQIARGESVSFREIRRSR